jgi:hypothetical protein
MQVELILRLLEQGLILWNNHESQKYLDRLIKLKSDWYEEYNKPLKIRSDVALDAIDLKLRILSESFIQASKRENSKD